MATQIIRLPFRITDLSEDALVALNRNFAEIEYHLSELQQYMNNTGYGAIEEATALAQNLLLSGTDDKTPSNVDARNGRRFYWAKDAKKLKVLVPR